MIALIDQMAQRYGLLPSEVLSRASTFDMVIMDAGQAYVDYLSNPDRAAQNVPEDELWKIKNEV